MFDHFSVINDFFVLRIWFATAVDGDDEDDRQNHCLRGEGIAKDKNSYMVDSWQLPSLHGYETLKMGNQIPCFHPFPPPRHTRNRGFTSSCSLLLGGQMSSSNLVPSCEWRDIIEEVVMDQKWWFQGSHDRHSARSCCISNNSVLEESQRFHLLLPLASGGTKC